jgi:hypothetical protein
MMTAILLCLCGQNIEIGENQSILLENKTPFEQRDKNDFFLEYVCVFKTAAAIEVDGENDLLGVIADYYADPQNMPYEPSDGGDIILPKPPTATVYFSGKSREKKL